MKPTEFRIGNYVLNNLNALIEVQYHMLDFGYTVNVFDYELIPLTKDWLKKLGFERMEKINIWIKDKIQIGSYRSGYYLCVGIELKLSKKIKYVHQLQNLYFALTEKELILK